MNNENYKYSNLSKYELPSNNNKESYYNEAGYDKNSQIMNPR